MGNSNVAPSCSFHVIKLWSHTNRGGWKVPACIANQCRCGFVLWGHLMENKKKHGEVPCSKLSYSSLTSHSTSRTGCMGRWCGLCSHTGLGTYWTLGCCPSFLFCTGVWKYCSQSWAYRINFRPVFLVSLVHDTFTFKFLNYRLTWSLEPKVV